MELGPNGIEGAIGGSDHGNISALETRGNKIIAELINKLKQKLKIKNFLIICLFGGCDANYLFIFKNFNNRIIADLNVADENPLFIAKNFVF